MADWFQLLDKYSPPAAKEAEEEPLEFRPKKNDENKRNPDGTLDLHGHTTEQADHALRGFLREAQQNSWTKLLIIHGKGLHSENEAILGKLVFRWAEAQKGLRLEKAPARLGGSGASVVYITGKAKG